MFLKKGLKILSFLLLVAFVSVKTSGLHAISHYDDGQQTEHCIWCDVAVENTQQISFLQFSDLRINIPSFQEEITKHLASQIAFTSFHADGALFSRPPPAL